MKNSTILSIFIGLSMQLHADMFYSISGVTSDTSGTDFFLAANLIEGAGVGFDAAEPHNRTSADTWVTNARNTGSGDYFRTTPPSPGPDPRLVFDLGSDVRLGEISIWGYADGNGNGANRLSLRFATEAEGSGAFGSSIAYNPTFEPTQPVTPRQSFSFGNSFKARYVELTPEDNFFGINPPGGDRVGLGEVAFMVTIPEPSAGGLLLLGFALLGSMRRFKIHG